MLLLWGGVGWGVRWGGGLNSGQCKHFTTPEPNLRVNQITRSNLLPFFFSFFFFFSSFFFNRQGACGVIFCWDLLQKS